MALLDIAMLYASLLLATMKAKLPALAALSCAFIVFSMFHFIIRHPIFWFGVVLCFLEAASVSEGSRVAEIARKQLGHDKSDSNSGYEAMNTRAVDWTSPARAHQHSPSPTEVDRRRGRGCGWPSRDGRTGLPAPVYSDRWGHRRSAEGHQAVPELSVVGVLGRCRSSDPCRGASLAKPSPARI